MKNIFRNFENLPIRIRLTIWYTVSFMVVLAFSFLSFYLVTQNLIITKTDESLRNQADEITGVIKNQTISPTLKDIVLQTFEITKTNFVLILNNKQQIITQSQAFPINQQIISKLEIAIKNNNKPQYVTEAATRFYVVPLFDREQFLGTIIVGDSIAVIDEAFRILLNTLVLVFLIFMLPLILVSFFEADISLAPLRILSKTMNTITTKNLSERVAITNPRDEIGEVGTAFNRLLERIEKGFEKERQLIHDISHQLKTPLTALQTDIEIGLTKPRSEQFYKHMLHSILRDAQRMSSILKDMMNFAWAASENQDKNFIICNISSILEEAAEIVQQLGKAKHLKVITSIAPDLFVTGQKEKLLQIFLNILENAVKYSKKSGRIIMQASKNNLNVNIIIKDTGIGIKRSDLNHIFERFYRGKTKVGEGSGLGLAIAAALVKAHNGTIEVASQVNHGTTFVITLPIKIKIEPVVKKSIKPTPIMPITIKRPHLRSFIREHLTANINVKKNS